MDRERFDDFLKLIIESGMNTVGLKKSTGWAQIVSRAKRLYSFFLNECEVTALPFAYVRGVVAEAVEFGHWILVDEINLAPLECLDAIVQVRHLKFYYKNNVIR